jgi:aspartate aminotransferase
MFEEGLKLKEIYGDNLIFDYSLGNPDLEPPEEFSEILLDLLQNNKPGAHGYMPNAGIFEVREKVAHYLSRTLGAKVSPEMVIMTVGAAGAMNAALKTIVEPGDLVMVLAPFFMEYVFYADNHGASVQVVQTDSAFRPDIEKIKESLTNKTRAVIINSPNNPTGVIYSKEETAELAEVLRVKSQEFGRPIALISDEPYRKIVYNDVAVPSVFEAYENSVIVTSFSKDLSLAGERIGYLCVNPRMENRDDFVAGASLANRILGFVSAPALMQRAVSRLLDVSVDVSVYKKRVDVLGQALKTIGYELSEPAGSFYLFPKSPIPDDLEFVEILKKELILAVPGTGFSRPGHFRLSLCLDQKKIERSVEAFRSAYEKCGSPINRRS